MLDAIHLIAAVGPSVTQSDHRKLRRYDIPGHARELTFSCYQRRPYLASDRAKGWVVEAIRRAQETHRFRLWAWVIMPEHIRLLILPNGEQPEVGPVLNTIKQSVSRVALDWVRAHAADKLETFADRAPSGKISYRIWQRGAGYDRNLYSPEAIWNAIEYIHANPVRRGLCSHPLEWAWSGARAFARHEDSKLKLDLRTLPARPNE